MCHLYNCIPFREVYEKSFYSVQDTTDNEGFTEVTESSCGQMALSVSLLKTTIRAD